MKNGYFHRLHSESQTRFWINNPTPRQAKLAIEAGAIACTTNPTYASKMAEHPETRDEVAEIIDQVLDSGAHGTVAEEQVQQRCLEPLLKAFLPLYRHSGGTEGFVSIQGNPFLEDDVENILREMRLSRRLGPNVIAKIPVTVPGIEAIDVLVRENVPIIATEIMSVAQALHVAGVYERACTESGNRPAFFLTHITGIFDQYLAQEVHERAIDIEMETLWHAGSIVARRQFAVLAEHGFRITMLGGGARGSHHFTEMVGADIHVTINWHPTAEELIANDGPIVDRFHAQPDPRHLQCLLDKSATFRSAYTDDGLEPDEYAEFGPVALFREVFCDGWRTLSETISRAETARATDK